MARSLRPIEVFPITTRNLTVLRVSDVTPGMRRVTVGGEQLAAHVAENAYPVEAFRSDGFDDEFKVIPRHPDVDEAVVPTQNDGVLNWPMRDEHLLVRTYTVRRWDPVAGEIDIDIAKHGVGPGTLWSQSVQPGERIQIAGPKSSGGNPDGAEWILVAGDETALPAIGRWLETWPAGVRGQVFVEIEHASHRQDLPVPEGVELTWLSRDGAEAGTTTLLFDAIQATDWWDGEVFAWVAGEAITLTPIRRWLRNQKGLPKTNIEVTGYWRRQAVVVDDEGVQDLAATEDDGDRFHELTEMLPGFAVRVAATIGLGEALGADRLTIAEVAERTGTHPVGLAKLLRYLTELGLLEPDDEGRVALTSLGRELEDDHNAEHLNLAGYTAQRELATALTLLSAVRTGSGDHQRWFDGSFADRMVTEEALLVDRIEDEAEFATYIAGAVAAAAPINDGDTVWVAGKAPTSLAAAILKQHPRSRGVVRAAPSEIAVLERIHRANDRITYQPGSSLDGPDGPVDVVLISGMLDNFADADGVHLLSRAAAQLNENGRILVFGEVFDAELASDHDMEDDLAAFALHGGAFRDDTENQALFDAAGLVVTERSTVGWGFTLYHLTART